MRTFSGDGTSLFRGTVNCSASSTIFLATFALRCWPGNISLAQRHIKPISLNLTSSICWPEGVRGVIASALSGKRQPLRGGAQPSPLCDV